jgi:polysaccharide export outer membrane protein
VNNLQTRLFAGMALSAVVSLAPSLAAAQLATATGQTGIGQSATTAVDDRPNAPAPAAPSVGQQQVETALNLPSSYVLGAADELVIHAVDAPEISERPQRVDPDGDLRLPVIGRVHAAGMSVVQLEEELKKRLGVYLQAPDVTVTVTSSRSQTVSIMGAVMNAGQKPLDPGKTLIDVLSAAGGLSLDAGPTVRVVRKLDQGSIPLPEATNDKASGFSTVELDARALLDGRTPEKNFVILPNDVVAVPRASMVYVIGEVGRPGPVQLTADHSITVMEAVSTSGGVLKTAAPNKVRILRRVPGQEERAEISVDLQKMMLGKAKDVTMNVGDILVVPDSSGKKVTNRVIEAAVQMGTMIGTYGIVR